MTHKPISPLRHRMIEDMSVRKFCEKAQARLYPPRREVRRVSSAARPKRPQAKICAAIQVHQTENGVQPPTFNSAAVGAALFLPGHARPPRSRPPTHADQLSPEAAAHLKP